MGHHYLQESLENIFSWIHHCLYQYGLPVTKGEQAYNVALTVNSLLYVFAFLQDFAFLWWQSNGLLLEVTILQFFSSYFLHCLGLFKVPFLFSVFFWLWSLLNCNFLLSFWWSLSTSFCISSGVSHDPSLPDDLVASRFWFFPGGAGLFCCLWHLFTSPEVEISSVLLSQLPVLHLRSFFQKFVQSFLLLFKFFLSFWVNNLKFPCCGRQQKEMCYQFIDCV